MPVATGARSTCPRWGTSLTREGNHPGRVDARGRSAVITLMGTTETPNPDPSDELLRRAGAGDRHALAGLFDRYRDRLRRMVRLRMDRRLQGRVDPSDVLQEAQVEIIR